MAKRGRTANRGVRILSLDGGGVRGYSSLLILESLMKEIQCQGKLEEMPRPCDYFDIIGGTSSGGLLAIMLGHLNMTVAECKVKFERIASKSFQGNGLLRIPISLFGGSAYSAKVLESEFKQLVKEMGTTKNEDEPLLIKSGTTDDKAQGSDSASKENDNDGQCLCFVTATGMGVGLAQVFRDYEPHDVPPPDPIKIWEAARATSAAPSYFAPITIPKWGTYGDGGILANNPSFIALDEKQRMWGPLHKVACFVSIGTGIPSVEKIPKGLIGAVKGMLKAQLNADQQHTLFAQDHPELSISGRYFRFNVILGMHDIELDEWNHEDDIRALTVNYLTTNPEVKRGRPQCARRLLFMPIDLHEAPCRAPLAEPSSLPERFYLVPSPVRHFTPRPKLMDQIDKAWVLEQAKVAGSATVLVLQGLGGSGKSQMAFAFCEAHRGGANIAIRLDCSSTEAFNDTAMTALRRLGVPVSPPQLQPGVALKECIEGSPLTWHLVYDGLDNDLAHFPLHRFLPAQESTTIIVTTRLEEWRGAGAPVQVRCMETPEAKQLLFAQALVNAPPEVTRQAPEDTELDNRAQEIVQDLGCLPLAIDICGAYISFTKDWTFKRYIENRNEHRFKTFQSALSKAPLFARSVAYPSSVLTTWKMSIDAVQATRADAGLLLFTLAFFDPNNLHKELFWRAVAPKTRFLPDGSLRKISPFDIGIPPWLLSLATSDGELRWDDVEFEECISLLVSLSLLQKEADIIYHVSEVCQGPFGVWYKGRPPRVAGRYSLHPLVRDWLLLTAYEIGAAIALCFGIDAMRITLNAVPDDAVEGVATMMRNTVPDTGHVVATHDGGIWVDDGYSLSLLKAEDAHSHHRLLKTAITQLSRQAFASTAFFGELQMENEDSPLRVPATRLVLRKNSQGGLSGSYRDPTGSIVDFGPVSLTEAWGGIVSKATTSLGLYLGEYLGQRKAMETYFYSYLVFEKMEELRLDEPWALRTCVELPLLLRELERLCVAVDWTEHDLDIPGELNYHILFGRTCFAQHLTIEVHKLGSCTRIADENKVTIFMGLIRWLGKLQRLAEAYTISHEDRPYGRFSTWILARCRQYLAVHQSVVLSSLDGDEVRQSERKALQQLQQSLADSSSPELSAIAGLSLDNNEADSGNKNAPVCACEYWESLDMGKPVVWREGDKPPTEGINRVGMMFIDPNNPGTMVMRTINKPFGDAYGSMLPKQLKMDTADLEAIFEEKGIEEPTSGDEGDDDERDGNDDTDESGLYEEEDAGRTMIDDILEAMARREEAESNGKAGDIVKYELV